MPSWAKWMLRAVLALGIAAAGATAALLAIGGMPGRVTDLRRPPQPNIVLLSIDTLRADHLGCYGYARPTSPHIDALARESVLFENAFSHAPKTALSHMSILTSLLPAAHGVKQNDEPNPVRLSDDIPTLATLLRKQGYATFGISGGGHVSANVGFDQGMDFFGVEGLFRDAIQHMLALLDQHRRKEPKKPFFAFLHTYDVHDPYTPPERFSAPFVDPAYAGKIVSSGKELEKLAGGDDWGKRHEVYWKLVDPNDPSDVRHLRDLYDGGIRAADDQVQSLIEGLRARGEWDNTLFVLLSDHGEEFQEHGRFLHEQLYQELLHVPFLVRFPTRTQAPRLAGRREAGVVRMIDVLPTLLDVIGAEVPKHVQGMSLWPFLQGRGSLPPPLVASSWKAAGLDSLRQGEMKLIRIRWSPKQMLFDLNKDPGELKNLAPTEPAVAQSQVATLDAITKESEAFNRGRRAGKVSKPDQETLERLRALGYGGETK